MSFIRTIEALLALHVVAAATARSAGDDEPRAAIDTVDGLATPRRGVLALAARPDDDLSVHDATTLRAMADGRISASMVHVVAGIGSRGWGHQILLGLRSIPAVKNSV